MLYQKSAARTVEPLELEIAQDLPDTCSRHGRLAVSRQRFRACFYDTKQHPRFHRTAVVRVASKQLAPMSTILVGAWPVCDRCERERRTYRRAASILLSVMAANLAILTILIAAGWAGIKFETAVGPMVWAFSPGSIPLGLVAAVWLFRRSTEPVMFRQIDDEQFALVQAHPGFAAAMQAMPCPNPSDGPIEG
ncbi:hypothetical protein ACQP1G_23865 [Nocardia sp. CA-107356]|uniref:hypothetical protein n=1 Tax=Nocardia sp. CA-107356 TaxID=3239972 RepID=UPI003D90E606